jgi:CDP-4-dehydro-6-deoxyglucose reductase, E1
MTEQQIKNEIMQLIDQYHKAKFGNRKFIQGQTSVPVSGKVFDSDELKNITESALDAWFTTGRFNTLFEKSLREFIGVKNLITTNSGSSANLLAFASLTDSSLGDRAIKPKDEVITVAAGFPTTINPIIQYGCVPVFVDITIPEYQIDVSQLKDHLTDKTKAVMLAHTMGNTFDIDTVKKFCKENNLWLIEDCCDALGSTYNGQHVGTFGDVATLSFYPAHHITTGEGGAIFTKHNKLKKIIESFRDWGRDCWCEPGVDNTCGKRFSYQLGGLPFGYDHKYTYSRVGYNLKMTDMQASLGLAQMGKLHRFISKRKENFQKLRDGLNDLDWLILPIATQNSDPSWFGFLITIDPNSEIKRDEIIEFLNKKKIATRLLFGGDVRKQPYFKSIIYKGKECLPNTEIVMNNTFWIGTTPLIQDEMIQYVIKTLKEKKKFFRS